MMDKSMDFERLANSIEFVQDSLQTNARLVINRHVTTKAWLTGWYIVEYEQHGSDRAKYGDQLLKRLSERLGRKKYSVTTLKIYRQFFLTYPQLAGEVSKFTLALMSKGQSVTDQLYLPVNEFTLLSLREHLNNIGSNGATMTNVNKSKFESIEVIIPTKDLYMKFNNESISNFKQIENLSTQLRLLTEARDRLLSKLMSGEIEV